MTPHHGGITDELDELRQLVVQVTSRIDQLSLDIADDRERRPDTPSEFGSGEDVPSTYPTLSSPLASNRKKGKSASTPSRSGRKVEFEGAPTSNWSPSRNTGPTASGSHSSIIYSYGGPSIPAAASPRATTSTVRASGRALNLPKAEQERIKAGISNSDRIYVVYKGRGGVGVFKDWNVVESMRASVFGWGHWVLSLEEGLEMFADALAVPGKVQLYSR